MDAVSATIVAGRRARIRFNIEVNINKLIYINLLNLLNRFDSSIGTSMRKAAHPSGGVGSSNLRRWRGEPLHHHGDGVCLLFVLFVLSRLVVVTRCM